MTDSRLNCGRPLADFNLAFTAGHRFQRDEYQYEMEVVLIGDLCLPTGKIVASDPSSLDDYFEDYFETVAPPGTYPVDMALLHGKTTDGSQTFLRNACMRIRFQDAPIAEWRMATTRDQNIEELLPFQIYGYGVDAGLGSFADAAGVAALLAEYAKQGKEWFDFWEDTIMPALEAANAISGHHTRDFANILLDPSSGANLIICSSGWGDGSYASYWGLCKEGAPVSLVTDFGLLTRYVEAKRTLGSVKQLLAAPLHLTLPAGDVTIQIQMPDAHTLLMEESGRGILYLDIMIGTETEHRELPIRTGSYDGNTRTAEARFEMPVPLDAILICSYPDHLESLQG
jgi:hypothetical protein